ncbi:hypothetical protein [Kitasatospora sp. NPDC059327]|uniref:hypothetical protein n=1 Tax=Kitasatospora sp. NPDC059327 TaxID=3346803 RepID=UPI0036AA0F31
MTAACEALVAGLDSPAPRTLAARVHGEADAFAADLSPPAPAGSGLFSTRSAAVPASGRARLPTGGPAPREPAHVVHRRQGHEFAPAEALAPALALLDAEVGAEARRPAAHAAGAADGRAGKAGQANEVGPPAP